jgi:hypothetical protein
MSPARKREMPLSEMSQLDRHLTLPHRLPHHLYTNPASSIHRAEHPGWLPGDRTYPSLSRPRPIISHSRPDAVSISNNSRQRRRMDSRDTPYSSPASAAGSSRTRPASSPITKPNKPSYPPACQRLSACYELSNYTRRGE